VTGSSLTVVATALDTAVLVSPRMAVATPTGVASGDDPQPAVATATSASNAATVMTSWTHPGCTRFPIGSALAQMPGRRSQCNDHLERSTSPTHHGIR
jgi:hypothetical protein